MPLQQTQTFRLAPSKDELRSRLIDEWRTPRQDLKEPLIQETRDEAHAHPTRLRVVWDAWEGMDEFERSVLIMEAFEEVRGVDEVLYVLSAEGLTFEESERYGVSVVE